eukprot:scaffold55167_cov66-Phaeocystis_antarctica.AAC.5
MSCMHYAIESHVERAQSPTAVGTSAVSAHQALACCADAVLRGCGEWSVGARAAQQEELESPKEQGAHHMLTPPSRPHILTLCGDRPPPQEPVLPLDTNNPNPNPNPDPNPITLTLTLSNPNISTSAGA